MWRKFSMESPDKYLCNASNVSRKISIEIRGTLLC